MLCLVSPLFWSLCRLFGVLVSSCWVPLACLGCLWVLSATFGGAFGSSGLSVGSLCYFCTNLGEFVACSFHVLPSLGEFRWCWGCGLKVLRRHFRHFKRASHSHAKTGFSAIAVDLQNRAPMLVKPRFSEKNVFFVFKIDVLPAWEPSFRSESSSHVGKTPFLKTRKAGFHLFLFFTFIHYFKCFL